ncbi:Putative arsenical resistance operon repressor ArsR2 [uncultured archaeon]|nr:Putative arsenical resistance operon repressor ArsR2 [uncultured archaeon]
MENAGAIDRKAIRSLASDTRVSMLKRLADRRRMPSELSKEMGIAPSTVVEHLKELESAGLVRKEKTRRKWIYYELTEKGENIFRPRIPFQFILSLAIGFVVMGVSLWNFSLLQPQSNGPAAGEMSRDSGVLQTFATAAEGPAIAPKAVADGASNDLSTVFLSLAALGLLIVLAMLYSIYEVMRNRRK